MPELSRPALAEALGGTLTDVLEQQGRPVPQDLGPDTVLLGAGAVFDSLGLVTFIVDAEDRIEAEFGLRITLASERALSQTRSPFRTIGTLADYVLSCL